MLYGIRRDLQTMLVKDGLPRARLHPVRTRVVSLFHAPARRAAGQRLFVIRGILGDVGSRFQSRNCIIRSALRRCYLPDTVRSAARPRRNRSRCTYGIAVRGTPLESPEPQDVGGILQRSRDGRRSWKMVTNYPHPMTAHEAADDAHARWVRRGVDAGRCSAAFTDTTRCCTSSRSGCRCAACRAATKRQAGS